MPSSEESTDVTVAEKSLEAGKGSRVSLSLGEDGALQAHIQLDLKIDLTTPKKSQVAGLVEGGGDETKEAGRGGL